MSSSPRVALYPEAGRHRITVRVCVYVEGKRIDHGTIYVSHANPRALPRGCVHCSRSPDGRGCPWHRGGAGKRKPTRGGFRAWPRRAQEC